MNQPLFLSWKRYQRRSDLLATALGAEIIWRPSTVPSKFMRPVDYLSRLRADLAVLRERRPGYVVVQTPPHTVAFAPHLAKVPYVIDGHNGQFQGIWRRAPGAERILRAARLVITHTQEADEIARAAFPGLRTLVVRDPLQIIPPAEPNGSVFVVATLGVDEPMELLIDVFEAMPDIRFTTTAPLHRLPADLRARVEALPNIKTLGFLDLPDYEAALSGARAVVVLTDRAATQPSGACEALSAGRPLVLSNTATTKELFGSFATLVENERESLVAGIRTALATDVTQRVREARDEWMAQSAVELDILRSHVAA